MVILHKTDIEAGRPPCGLVVDLGKEAAMVAVPLRRHDLDAREWRVLDQHAGESPWIADAPPLAAQAETFAAILARTDRAPPVGIVEIPLHGLAQPVSKLSRGRQPSSRSILAQSIA